jgi:hypothetical protein
LAFSLSMMVFYSPTNDVVGATSRTSSLEAVFRTAEFNVLSGGTLIIWRFHRAKKRYSQAISGTTSDSNSHDESSYCPIAYRPSGKRVGWMRHDARVQNPESSVSVGEPDAPGMTKPRKKAPRESRCSDF